MASTLTFSIFSFSLLFLTTIVSARPFHPCTTFVISTYSFSLLPQNPNPNPSPNFLIVSTTTNLRPFEHHHFRHRRFLPLRVENSETRPELGFGSLKDRTKDILSVVGSLVLGAACGALTAGTLYLVWSIFNNNCRGGYRSFDVDVEDDDDVDYDDGNNDVFNPKKKGYVIIQANEPVKVVDSIPDPTPSAA